jgi:hypothetical protein
MAVNLLVDVASAKTIGADEVLRLRRDVFKDGVVSRGEAESLFSLDASSSEKSPEWTDFFLEALTDYVLYQEQPEGYISQETANWLMAAVSHDGKVDTASELELLVRLLEKARSAPASLASYTLKQVANAVLHGSGPLARGGQLRQGRISKEEVDLMRRILHASGGEANVAVTRAEAEVLFMLNDGTADAANDPSWTDLFVKAIANSMLYASGYSAPSREEALKQSVFLDSPDGGLAGFFSRMISGGLSGVIDAYRRDDGLEEAFAERNAINAAKLASAEHLDAAEARWLADQIGKDGKLDGNERELLIFVKDLAADIHDDLKPLLAKVA